MLRAGRHAYYMGKTLNWQVTIDFGLVEFGDELVPFQLLQDIRKRVWSWWDYKRRLGIVSGPLLDWVTWECPKNQAHANWLIFMPEALWPEFRRAVNDRCRKVLGELDADTVDQQEIWNANGLMFYTLKGTQPEYAKKIKIKPSEQGTVWFRRAYSARALGPAARERDWNEGRVTEQPKTSLPKPREVREIIRRGGVLPLAAASAAP